MNETPSLVVVNIGELVTGDPRLPAPGVVRNAVLAASGDRVVYAGAASGFHLGVDAATVEVDARGAAVLPGFVDSHTHLVWLGDRSEEFAQRAEGASYEEIAAAGGGIRATAAATSAGSIAELAATAEARARRMLRLGTTTVEVKSGYGVDGDAELRQLEAAHRLVGRPGVPDVALTYLPLHAPPGSDRSAQVEAVLAMGLPAAARLARCVDCFCDPAAWSVEECERVLRAGLARGMRPKIHAEQRSRSGGAALAARLGAVSADHLEHADDADLRGLAAAGVTGVLLPGASLVLGGPPPPGRRLLEAGAPVAVATDCNPGTCWCESMPLMVSLAVATAGLTPAQALLAATAGGALALGLSDRGRLVPGLRCDALVLDSPHWIDVAYHLGANPVARVIAAGRLEG
jgi:imidazolonepropionase